MSPVPTLPSHAASILSSFVESGSPFLFPFSKVRVARGVCAQKVQIPLIHRHGLFSSLLARPASHSNLDRCSARQLGAADPHLGSRSPLRTQSRRVQPRRDATSRPMRLREGSWRKSQGEAEAMDWIVLVSLATSNVRARSYRADPQPCFACQHRSRLPSRGSELSSWCS